MFTLTIELPGYGSSIPRGFMQMVQVCAAGVTSPVDVDFSLTDPTQGTITQTEWTYSNGGGNVDCTNFMFDSSSGSGSGSTRVRATWTDSEGVQIQDSQLIAIFEAG
jgi:hypothetical protein